ncbi:MAG: SPOR domain-containing protein [Gemmatimonadetes bacterium]|nr:SPOR domain-containing protein [Gemmatimonadota bacterium]
MDAEYRTDLLTADRRHGGASPAHHSVVSLLLLASLSACGSDASRNPVKTAFAQRPATRGSTAVAFRFPPTPGARVRVYRLPRLDEITFRFNTPGLAAVRVIGFAEDEDQIFLLSPQGTVIALDLGTGRARTVDSSVTAAVTDPTGTPYLVRADGSVAAVEHRVAAPWSTKLPDGRISLVGAGRDMLLAELRENGTRELLQVAENRPLVRLPIPEGPIAATAWGEAVMIGTYSGWVTVNPARPAATASVAQTDARPDAIALSPSGHRAYAIVGSRLLVIDRSRAKVVAERDLPGLGAEVRPDPYGRLLLLRPAAGDSIWIFEVATNRYVATLPGSWTANLPMVAPDGTILTRQGADLATVAGDSLTPAGRIRGGGNDRWLTLAWDPRRPIPQLADDAEPLPQQVNQELFVQVSVSQNQAWADENAQNLRRAGLNAIVLPPANPEEGFRVVLGPYPTREAAEDAGRRLGRPYWIFSRQPPTTQ